MNEDKENKDRPGVSGKDQSKKTWINVDKLHEQEKFAHKMHEYEDGYGQSTGNNLFGRSDLSNQQGHEKGELKQEQVLEVLKRSPTVDVAHLDVSVEGGSVILRGSVDDPEESRAMENIVKNIPGVTEVINELDVEKGEDLPHH